MRRFGKFLLIAGTAILAMSSTAFAGTWKQDNTGWYWLEDNGDYPASSWQWLDGNGDGVAECYYFNEDGYLLTNTQTPDGYQVDAEGRWVENGAVKTRGGQDGPGDAWQQYEEATKKTSAMDNFAAKADVDMKMSADGLNMDMTMEMDMKMKNLNTSDIKILMDMRVNLLGESQTATAFYTDGYYYMDMMGQKVKMAMPLEDIVESSKNSSNGMIQESQYIQDLQVSTDGSGNKVFTFTCSPESYNEVLKQVGQLNTDMSAIEDIKITEYSGSMTVNPDGYITTSDIIMKFQATVTGMAVSYDIKMKIDYINPGQPVDFTLPSTDGYTLQ